MTPKEILEEKIPAKLAKNPEKGEAINSQILFDISGESGGKWLLDCTKKPATVVAGDVPDAKVTILMTDTDFVSMIDGELNPQKAFLMGKIKVKGDLSIALKLGSILS